VIVMIVGDQQQVHAWQCIQALPGPAHAARTCEADGAASVRPDRVGEHADAADLQQERRVTDERRHDPVVRGAVRRWQGWVLNVLRPRLQLARALPAAKLAEGPAVGSMRVEEPAPVKVNCGWSHLRSRTAVSCQGSKHAASPVPGPTTVAIESLRLRQTSFWQAVDPLDQVVRLRSQAFDFIIRAG
jgi:hypothetical protein